MCAVSSAPSGSPRRPPQTGRVRVHPFSAEQMCHAVRVEGCLSTVAASCLHSLSLDLTELWQATETGWPGSRVLSGTTSSRGRMRACPLLWHLAFLLLSVARSVGRRCRPHHPVPLRVRLVPRPPVSRRVRAHLLSLCQKCRQDFARPVCVFPSPGSVRDSPLHSTRTGPTCGRSVVGRHSTVFVTGVVHT